MFESATLKITLLYMGILTVICLFFSYNWYTIASNSLTRSLQDQEQSLKRRPNFITRDLYLEIVEEANEAYEEQKDVLLSRVILTNVMLITAGTLGSYYLARRSIEPIEKAHREQIRFTADASHELRTPLASMQTEIEVALRDKKLTKQEAITQLESNLEELAKLSSLSDGLLSLARNDEHSETAHTKISLDSAIEKALSRVQKPASQKNITFARELTDSYVEGNHEELTDLFVILFDNAIKYSPKKSVVNIASEHKKGHLHVSVTDQGIGISKAEQKAVFDRFYRADNSRSSQNIHGNGLGLAIARSIAESHRAELSVASEGVNLGTTFTLSIKKVSYN